MSLRPRYPCTSRTSFVRSKTSWLQPHVWGFYRIGVKTNDPAIKGWLLVQFSKSTVSNNNSSGTFYKRLIKKKLIFRTRINFFFISYLVIFLVRYSKTVRSIDRYCCEKTNKLRPLSKVPFGSLFAETVISESGSRTAVSL